MGGMAPTLQVLLQSPLTSVAVYGEVVITIVHTELTLEALRTGVAANKKLGLTYPRGVASLAIAPPTAKMPNAETRTAASQAVEEALPHTLCAAQVIMGEGFWYSTLRSVLTAIEQFRPNDRPRRTFRDLDEALAWLSSQLQKDVQFSTSLRAAVQTLIGTDMALGQATG